MTKTKGLSFTAGLVLATAFTFCSCKEEAKAVASLGLITPNAVGIFQKGNPIPLDNKDYVFKEDSTDYGQGANVYYEVYQGGEKILIIYSYGSIRVLSGRFATAEGIGVGSTIEELRKAYPKAEVAGASAEDLDEFYIDFEPASGGTIRVIFSHDDFSNKDINPDDAKITDLKKGAKIKEIAIL